jgi:mannonate dehydratase
MPLLDWTRTDLDYRLPDGSIALRFDATALAAFDIHILKRPDAENSYSHQRQAKAKIYYDAMSAGEVQQLTDNIIAGLPGAEEGYTTTEFLNALSSYNNIDAATLKANLFYFLEQVTSAAEQASVLLCIHPDDPPFPILGLPRVVSTEQDIADIYNAVDSPNNGLTFCTGSLGVNADNDLPDMVKRFGDRIHFIHLRSTKRDDDGNFHEASHLAGDVDMYAVMLALLQQQQKRINSGRKDISMPFRPDHGHKMLDDLHRKTNPGYSAIGRLKGLAELRGLELGIKRTLDK